MSSDLFFCRATTVLLETKLSEVFPVKIYVSDKETFKEKRVQNVLTPRKMPRLLYEKQCHCQVRRTSFFFAPSFHH